VFIGVFTLFLPARCYASAGSSFGPACASVSVCLCLSQVSVIIRGEQIDLVFGMEAFFDQSYTLLL